MTTSYIYHVYFFLNVTHCVQSIHIFLVKCIIRANDVLTCHQFPWVIGFHGSKTFEQSETLKNNLWLSISKATESEKTSAYWGQI